MNPLVRKSGVQIGLLVSFFQILITTYLFKFGSFIDVKMGILIIVSNLIFGFIAILLIKKKQNNTISLRESFSGYFITVLISIVLSSVFYLLLFNVIATNSKKEEVKKELFDFQLKQMKENNFSEKDIQQNILISKNTDPFGVLISFQSSIKFLLLYSVVGILISFILKNKSSFQETP